MFVTVCRNHSTKSVCYERCLSNNHFHIIFPLKFPTGISVLLAPYPATLSQMPLILQIKNKIKQQGNATMSYQTENLDNPAKRQYYFPSTFYII